MESLTDFFEGVIKLKLKKIFFFKNLNNFGSNLIWGVACIQKLLKSLSTKFYYTL